MPAVQLTQLELTDTAEKEPAGHKAHTVAPKVLAKVPAGQTAQVLLVAPTTFEKLPSEQKVHVVEPDELP